MNQTLGKRIGALRREKGLKQDELAEKLGISPQAVSKWETDQTCPDISLLPQLAKLLDVSVDELLSGKQECAPAVRMLPENERKDIRDMMLRIVIESNEGDHVRVNLPLALVEVAIESGMNLSQVSDHDALKSIDFAKIFELVKQGAIGNLVEMESADGETLRIFVE
ncbi:MAG: helix-turn-helix transcriptional regulator [Clostridia bacterium]|nr:helix-turn-helix transcriptional regulator [Clostridia bacterium]